MSEGVPEENLEKINRELKLYSPELLDKPMAVAGTKLDIKGDGQRLDRLMNYCKDKHYDFFPICAATGEGLQELISYLAKIVE
jgi:GTP-binding protein